MNNIRAVIRQELATQGPISFARFMDLALYYPGLGYYERPHSPIGKRGDFFTNISVGPLFGGLLAFQAAQRFDQLAGLPPLPERPDAPGTAPRPVQWVEVGAHDGQLARDFLGWFEAHRPDWLARMEYGILEPSPGREHRQREQLQRYAGTVRWFRSWADRPGPVRGVIFSNELLDAMPVRRIGWDASRHTWFEWGVDWRDDRFVWKRLSADSASDLSVAMTQMGWSFPEELLAQLPDGFVAEMPEAAVEWWRAAARALAQGWLVACDYGFETSDVLVPHRAGGTLRSYRRHQLLSDPLEQPGEADITAHVPFATLQRAGEAEGLTTRAFVRQAAYLTEILRALVASPLGATMDWPKVSSHWQTLSHPDHLGARFHFLEQSRGLPPANLGLPSDV